MTKVSQMIFEGAMGVSRCDTEGINASCCGMPFGSMG